MKINGNSIRPGNIIEHQGRLWRAVKTQHTQPGKGGAYLQVELKDIRDGTKLNERFRSSETVERVHLDGHAYQFLYREADQFTFMESETFEQIVLPEDMIGEPAVFLSEGMTVRIMSYEGEPISVELPDTVVMRVVEADPAAETRAERLSGCGGHLRDVPRGRPSGPLCRRPLPCLRHRPLSGAPPR